MRTQIRAYNYCSGNPFRKSVWKLPKRLELTIDPEIPFLVYTLKETKYTFAQKLIYKSITHNSS